MFNVVVRVERARLISLDAFGRAIGVIILINRMGLPLAGALVVLGSAMLRPQSVVIAVAGLSALTILAMLRFLNRPAASNAVALGVVHDVS
jgi:hypothetical protein